MFMLCVCVIRVINKHITVDSCVRSVLVSPLVFVLLYYIHM